MEKNRQPCPTYFFFHNPPSHPSMFSSGTYFYYYANYPSHIFFHSTPLRISNGIAQNLFHGLFLCLVPFYYTLSLLLLLASCIIILPPLSPCLLLPFPRSPNLLHPISSRFPSHCSCIPLHLAFLRHVMIPPTLQLMSLGPEQSKKTIQNKNYLELLPGL